MSKSNKVSNESWKERAQREKQELSGRIEGTDESQKETVLDLYQTQGQAFVEAFQKLSNAVLNMGGIPTSKGFREVRDLAGQLALKSEALATLCEHGEKEERRRKDARLVRGAVVPKFTEKPIDPTATKV